ncbi:hypothetical protein QTH97_26130 [Variovorax sp. J22R24]|uniref:hypothetical protein n=1 Tax=Variovorax gracilis TaxID=3053502 RepID=UPI002578D552|nr:hypothetical protein [Variovorax sp. J22R24]MDM0108454.1 hypothetical protein [Variovorax sp. J22R24]
MKKQLFERTAVLIGVLLIASCSKRQEVVEAAKFDPKFIAAEADKGNLAPLTELNAACSLEIEKHGKRLSACTAQDEVRRLSKPLNIRF